MLLALGEPGQACTSPQARWGCGGCYFRAAIRKLGGSHLLAPDASSAVADTPPFASLAAVGEGRAGAAATAGPPVAAAASARCGR